MFHYYDTRDGSGNGDDGYADLASMNHYFNLKGPATLVSIDQDPPNIPPTEMEKFLKDPWKLLVFEDEILGVCGSGAQNCSHTGLTGQTNGRKKRSASTGKWSFLSYQKVKVLSD